MDGESNNNNTPIPIYGEDGENVIIYIPEEAKYTPKDVLFYFYLIMSLGKYNFSFIFYFFSLFYQ